LLLDDEFDMDFFIYKKKKREKEKKRGVVNVHNYDIVEYVAGRLQS